MAKYNTRNPEDRARLKEDAEKMGKEGIALTQKATMEMLSNARRLAEEKNSDNPVALNTAAELFDRADDENREILKQYGGEKSVESMDYRKPDEGYVKKYKEKFGDNDGEGTKMAVAELSAGKKKRKTKKTEEDNTADTIKQEEKNTENKKPNVMENDEMKPWEKRDYKPFDPSTVPSNVQFDMIPLPSRGECYAHKKGKIPVAYLTAADENVMVSPNLMRDGKVIEMILKRKILDKDFVYEDLCEGDIEAIVLWLRSTAFGNTMQYRSVAPNGNVYMTTVDLSKVTYKEISISGNEDGEFEYTTGNGDKITFRYLNRSRINDIVMNSVVANMGVDIENAKYFVSLAQNTYDKIKADKSDDEDFNSSVDTIKEILDGLYENNGCDGKENTIMTDTVAVQTMSVNGNRDREYVKEYINSMLLGEFRKYSNYLKDNEPGMDLSITVNIPESDGGGSYETFLRLRDDIFLAD